MSNSSSSDDSLMLMSRIFSTNTNSVGVGPSDSESGLQWQIPKFIEEDEGVTRYGPTTSHTNRKNDDQGLTASLLYENSTPSLHSSSYPESRKKAPSALAVLVAEGVSGSRVAPRPTEAHIYAQNQVQMPLQTHPAASIVSSIVENSMGLYDMGTNTNDMGVEGSVAPSSTHNSNSGSQSQAVPAEPLEHVDSPVDVAVAKASVEETAPGGRGGRGRGGRGRGRGAADGRSGRGGRGRGDRLNTSAEGKDDGGKGRAVKEGPGAPKPSPASVPTSSASMGAQTAVAAKAPKVKQQKAKPKEEIENAPVSAAPTDESNDEKGRGGKGKSRRGKIGSVVSGSDTSENVVQSDAIATKHKPNSTQKVRKPVPEDGAPVDIIVSTTKRVIPPSRAERADLSGPPVRPVSVEEAATGGRGGRGRGRGRTAEGRSGRGGRGRGDRLSTTAKGKSDNGPPANPK